MATLNFVKKGSGQTSFWEATAKVTADFNVHIERLAKGVVYVGVSTVEGGQYAEFYQEVKGPVFDQDFDLQVYPKYIQVRSSTEVVSGAVDDTKEQAEGTTEFLDDEEMQNLQSLFPTS